MPERTKNKWKTAAALGLVMGLGSTTTAGAQDANLRLTQLEIESHARTCSHFAARARFQPRPVANSADVQIDAQPGAQLEVMLADSCERAFSSLYQRVDTAAYEAQHARAYLDKLAAFKATLIAINMDRMFGAEHISRRAKSADETGVGAETSGIRPISTTGEYLIARQMGIIGAYREWADVAKFTMAEDR
jgi:hypothetical protein